MIRLTLLLAASAAVAMPAFAQDPVVQGGENVPGNTPAFPEQTDAPAMASEFGLITETVTGGLERPWGIAVLPDDAGYLVTERPGRLRHVGADGTLSDPISGVPDVLAEEQGGLLDVALAPDFAQSRVIYLTYAKPLDGGSATAATRAVLSEDLGRLTDLQDIFVQTPASPTPLHYGSRVLIAPDGHVFVTTGEHYTVAERALAQELDTTYGRVVRVTPEGEVPADNPFVDRSGATAESWTLGQRNIQGAAIRPGTGQLWTIEHGPAGGDELNLIAPGENYGWPVVTYGENYDGTPVGTGEARHAPEFTEPVYYWDPVIAPAGMTFYDGDLFADWQDNVLASGLVAGGLVRLGLDGDRVVGEERVLPSLGRVRDVTVDADGTVLVVTDAVDGALIRISPDA